MRILCLLACAGCSSAPAPKPDFPLLPGDPPRADPSPANHIEPLACIPAGDYTVTWDLAPATITPHGDLDMVYCKGMAEAIPVHLLGQMRIVYAGGELQVDWPARQTVSAAGCELDITSKPVPAHVTFANGVGSGTSDYSVGNNNPNEKEDTCEVKGARFTMMRKDGAAP